MTIIQWSLSSNYKPQNINSFFKPQQIEQFTVEKK